MRTTNGRRTGVDAGRLLCGAAVSLAALGLMVQSGCSLFGGQNPVVEAGTDQNTMSGNTVTLQGSATDADGDALSYQWTYVSGPPAGSHSFVTATNQATVQLTCTGDGDYEFRLTATDARGGSGQDTVWVHVGTAYHVMIPVNGAVAVQ